MSGMLESISNVTEKALRGYKEVKRLLKKFPDSQWEIIYLNIDDFAIWAGFEGYTEGDVLEAKELEEAIKRIYIYLEVGEDNIVNREEEWVEILEALFDEYGFIWDIEIEISEDSIFIETEYVDEISKQIFKGEIQLDRRKYEY